MSNEDKPVEELEVKEQPAFDGKCRYWWAVLYPENMREDWKESLGDIVQKPFAYCVHDKDSDGKKKQRKVHVHLMLVWNNNTTYNAAFRLFSKLNAKGKVSVNKIEPCEDVRHCYDYLIHDTEDCRKKKKFLYPASERITGNNFDIGAYEQFTLYDKKKKVQELSKILIDKSFDDYSEWFAYVVSLDDGLALDVALAYSGHFDRLCKGIYHKNCKNFQKVRQEIVKQTFETNRTILEQMSENQRMASIREYAQLAALGLDPVTGEVIDGLPFGG